MANVAARLSKVEERLSLLSTMASEWGMGADSQPLANKGAWTRRQTQAPERRMYGYSKREDHRGRWTGARI